MRRRFASRENLALLAPAVKAGAELRIATDIAAYAEHAVAEVAESPGWRLAADGREPWAGLAGDPLRSEGAGGGAGTAVPDGRADVKCVIARAQFPVKRGS